jgi:hypothetical protein
MLHLSDAGESSQEFPSPVPYPVVLPEQILRVFHIEVPNFAMKVSGSSISEAQGRTVENSKFHDIIFFAKEAGKDRTIAK